ncbi:Ail/Lom family outer membrane beta-barrel protein [Lelliottia sp. V106_10]|uniref:Ail/Lom family outer membrane beta-barrel protein n=1 Tax=Lelliottia wanjuensis TaxID=3050585 RepID=UPI00254B6AF7|nr:MULTISPECIES: Ail/Lom family outer membrane beta-barrel protein [unclassified Lelliottia]MDK9358013.1 Ail/Lom family outer membrane beta-barrel protein [Lelliottia sp. V106_16]MDK9375003.1 Ail/Lom family outer membrane beta-barrel protein [Lelliottia sp. V106_10]MDK9600610.1 Ail/Lom family outer membrane beta-barrel protein [Lelliottia sp. V106_5]
MSMKYSVLTAVFLSALGVSAAVQAESSITAGYAQAHVEGFKNINGINLKYRYEWNSPLSIITSFTFMTGSESSSYYVDRDKIDLHANVKYYSLAAGPAWRFNETVSVYALLGASYNKVDYNYNWKNYEGTRGLVDMGNVDGESHDSTSLVYGAGVQISPLDNFVIDVGYEGSKLDDGANDHAVNGFNIGVGYRF